MDKLKANAQKNTLLKNPQANAESNFFKRVFFSPTQEKLLPTLLFLIKLFSPTHGLTANLTRHRHEFKSLRGQFCTDFGRHYYALTRTASANNTYKKLAVQWLNKALCFVSSFVVADSLVLRNRQLLVAANRCRKPY